MRSKILQIVNIKVLILCSHFALTLLAGFTGAAAHGIEVMRNEAFGEVQFNKNIFSLDQINIESEFL